MASEKDVKDVEDVDFTKYPEGMMALAAQLDLPIPKENMEQRAGYVMAVIMNLANRW